MSEATRPNSPAAGDSSAPAPWSPDRGDGTYQNPVLFADYSDPDAIRVGDDYWMVSSSFSHVPGLPILHSRDLVNWRLVNHALPALEPRDHFSTPRHGAGVWAPALRHHAGRFWIFYPDPDFGIRFVTAEDPRQPWSAPTELKLGKGLIDSCPFWDDDGQAYLVHGWAKSRAGISNRLTLHGMAADGSRLLDDGQTIIDGDQMAGWKTIEGPKVYKRGGWYYIFAPAGGVAEGYQAVFRAKQIQGPYEARVVLEQGATAINGPHQGAWVDTASGEHWFLHFQEIPAYGRVVHLQPMSWGEDGWPAMGAARAGHAAGEPVLAHSKPAAQAQAPATPATSDEFLGPALGLQWQWQANPRPDWASLGAAPGSLRLNCVRLTEADQHWLAGHLLLQKFPAPEFTATVELRFGPSADGDTAGLMVFGYDYAWLGLKQCGPALRLVFTTCRQAQKGGSEIQMIIPVEAGRRVWLRSAVSPGARCQFSYSSDGLNFTSVGDSFQAVSSKWVGAKVGLFASAAPGADQPGHAEFNGFHVTE